MRSEEINTYYCLHAVADPGFDLRGGGVDFVNGGGIEKVLKVEVKVILACFGYISIKIMLKINLERSERRKKM